MLRTSLAKVVGTLLDPHSLLPSGESLLRLIRNSERKTDHSLCHSCLVCRAYINSTLKSEYTDSLEGYDKTLAVLRLGRDEWRNVREDAVFDDTFVRGIRLLRLDSSIRVHSAPSS